MTIRSLAFASLMMSTLSFAAPALSQTATPTPAPATPVLQECGDEFVLAYISTSALINATLTYAKVGEFPPGIFETAFACRRIQTDFPEMTCQAHAGNSVRKLGTSDFAQACERITEFAVGLGFPKGPIPGPATDAHPIGSLNARAVKFTVKDPAAAQLLVENPSSLYAADGAVRDLKGALEAGGALCAIRTVSEHRPKFEVGQVFRGYLLFEEFESGTRISHIIFAAPLLDVYCSSHAMKMINLGDFKKAFDSIFAFEIVN